MRWILGILVLTLTTTVQASVILARASLDYFQEVAPINPTPSSATGEASLSFDPGSGLVDLEMSVTGISLAEVTFPGGGLAFGTLGPLHIHAGAAGSNGPIVVPFPELAFFSDTGTGLAVSASNVPFDTALLAGLRAGNLYLNLHSLEYPSGQIRGQLAVVPAPSVLALFGAGLLAVGALRRRRG